MVRASEFLVKVLLIGVVIAACSSKISQPQTLESIDPGTIKDSVIIDSLYLKPILVGAENSSLYLPDLVGKKVAVVGNQTSLIGKQHLVDFLIDSGVDVRIVFSPEHGFRGDHHAGADVSHGKDEKTGLRIFSLHGKTKKPTVSSLDSVDVIVFDIQDVGARFYTYISTLHYVMEAAAENNKEVMVLDRPNPNAHYIDGPILKPEYKSFIGMHPVPVVYGMTIGEYGRMINGEFWLKDSLQCKLKVIPLQNWTYDKEYVLPVAPSPNLPNQKSIYLYPSLCFLEGTEVSLGRGTEHPFQIYGHPGYTDTAYSFTPVAIPGKSKYPKHEKKVCFGVEVKLNQEIKGNRLQKTQLDFSYIEDAINKTKPNKEFFDRTSFFNLLAGTDTIVKHFKKYKAVGELSNSWQEELRTFQKVREKYLLYKRN